MDTGQKHIIAHAYLDTPGAVTYRCGCGKSATFALMTMTGKRIVCNGQYITLEPLAQS